MYDNRWTDETVPSPRAARDAGSGGILSGLFAIPIHVWLAGVIVAVLALATCGLAVLLMSPGLLATEESTPTLIVWTALPVPSPTPPPTPTDEPTPTSSPGLAIGRYAQVVGTGGNGINLRQQPDVNSPRISTDLTVSIGLEGEIFIVVDGPRQVGGITWWLVRDLDDESRQGWAAGNYLQPVAHP